MSDVIIKKPPNFGHPHVAGGFESLTPLIYVLFTHGENYFVIELPIYSEQGLALCGGVGKFALI
ncbi:MAG: hypothetical protein ABJM43_17610 [Paracoccaceae bacterium]